MKKHLIKFIEILLGYNEEDSLITKEGYEILADPIKRAKLREWIEIYHKTGVWDYDFWNESKDEKLSQDAVIKSVCVSCDEQKETHEICMDCVKKMIKENQQTDL